MHSLKYLGDWEEKQKGTQSSTSGFQLGMMVPTPRPGDIWEYPGEVWELTMDEEAFWYVVC